MRPPAIEVRRLTKRFLHPDGWFRNRSVMALEEVSFCVASGEVMGLMGPNGSGKSTLLKILNTVLLPTSGTAWVGGSPIWETQRVKAQVGWIPEDARGFHGYLSGRQNLEFFAACHHIPFGAARARIERLLNVVGLSGLGKQPVWSYSAGQRQGLNIARALLHDPPVLLWDEPTKGLDPWAADALRQWVREELVRGSGKTLLVATHQREDTDSLCDRMLFLQGGRIAS